MGLRKMELILDAADFDTIQGEIAERQRLSRAIDPDGGTILPEGESNLAGAILAECIRDLCDYRVMWEAERSGADDDDDEG